MSSTTKAKSPPRPAERPLDLDINCQACGSADRSDYTPVRQEVIDRQRIAWKRCTCTHCGQTRVNRFGRFIDANDPRRG